jgi:S-DNA-T family DNA segregation ATPase FtsK/SpoIIIE
MARKTTKRSSTRKSSPSSSHRRRSTSGATRISRQLRSLSPERKLDILGVLLLLLGVITLFGFFNGSTSGLIGGINQVLGWIAVLGAGLFPLILIFLGIWFMVRNEQRFPMLSPERMLGVVFLYLDILAWMHWFSGGGWDLAEAGRAAVPGQFLRTHPGGYSGRLGRSGIDCLAAAWLAFTFDLSIPDLFRNMTKPAVKPGNLSARKPPGLLNRERMPAIRRRFPKNRSL